MRNTFSFVKWVMCSLLLAILWTASASEPITTHHLGDPPSGTNIPCPSFTGPNVSCVNGLNTYLTMPVAGSSYAWSTSSGGVASNLTGPSTLVNWTASGTQYVVLTTTGVGASVCTLWVNVSVQPTPFIQTNFVSDCPEDRKEELQGIAIPPQGDKEECWVVCEFTNVQYWTNPVAGNTYSWVVVGGTPVTATGSSITVNWGPSGTGSVYLTETAPGGCSETVEKCIKIVDAPVAGLQINGMPYSGPVKICLGETVYFDDQSIGATSWYWEFGDGATSTLQEPSHQYTTSGIYNGLLTVKNECGCESTFPFVIEVSDLAAPEIGCISTVCLKDCAFYSVTNMGGCPGGNVSWSVSGGQLIGPVGASTIQVEWDDSDGFIQANGYGLICATVTNCATLCDGTVCARVPVIHQPNIAGPIVACVGDPVTYSIPIQPGINEPTFTPNGVDFDWIIAVGGTIISQAPYSNSITVIWNNPGTYTLDLDVYENYLTSGECKFDPTPITVTVKPTFTISPLNATVCLGGSQTFNATGVGPFNWTVTGPVSSGPTAGTSSFTLSPTAAGTYVVSAQSTSGNYCNVTPAAVLTVLPAPPAPTGTLSGQLSVCLNTPYTYTLNTAPPPGTVLVWTATGGTVYGGAGQTVTAQWTGGPMTLTVQTMSTTAPFCLSAPLNFVVTNYVPPTNFVTGPGTACVNETKVFNVSGLSNYTNLQWSVLPATAGSVVVGQNTTAASVLFNTSAPANVTISCTATVCGSPHTSFIVVNITQIPTYTINVSPNPVCQNDLATLTLSPATGVSGYNWNFGDGGPNSNAASPAHAWASTGSFPITAQLTLNICGGPTVSAATTVNVLPDPVVNVTANNGYVLCPPLYPANTNLVASAQFACTYAWSTGGTGNTITVSTPGTYTVTATSVGTGCTATSSVIVVGCGNCNNPCTSATLPWTFTATENCDTYTFTPITTGATFFAWNFGDGTGNTTSGSSPVSHTYAHPGYYYVRLTTIDPINGCVMTVQQQVIVQFKGDFSYTFNCSSGVMLTTLTDRSEYLPTATKLFTWYKVGTGIIAGPSASPTYTGTLTSGTYYLSVLINGTQTCTTPQQVITVPGLPVAAIAPPLPKCEGLPILFTNNSTGALSYSWAFGDGATSGVISPSRTYMAPPTTYTVTLTANSAWGCASTATATVTVHNSGTVASPGFTVSPASGQACQGSPITITAATGLPATPLSYGWYNSAAPNAILGPGNTFMPTVSGTYGVLVTDNNGCPYNVLTTPVVFLPPPVVQIVGKTDYCPGEFIQLSAQLGNNPGFTYNWNITTPLGSTTSFGPTINLNSLVYGPGNYTFTATITHTASGCTNTGSLAVVVRPGVLGLNITSNNACEPATLTAFGTNAISYNWSNGTNAPSTTVNQGGYYSVIATDAFGCSAEESYYLEGRPDLSNIMVGCYDFCEPVTWQAINCSGCSYQWFENGNPMPGANTATQLITTSGVYTVVVTNSQGCSSTSDPINVSISSTPDLCEKCDVKVETAEFECVGIDPGTGLPIYAFSITVGNYGGALHGLNAFTTFGNAVITSPSNGYLPGGGAVTTISGLLYWDGSSFGGCFRFQGFLTEDCNIIDECWFDWCGELPKCCDKPCALKEDEVSAECIGGGLYEVTVTLKNDGCKLFNAMVFHYDNGNTYPLVPNVIPVGTTTFTFIVQGQPGINTFRLCGFDFQGNECCVEFQTGLKECPPTECNLEPGIIIVDCIGRDALGNPIYTFSGQVFGAPAGATFYLVSNLGYVTSLNWTYVSSGNYYQLNGTYVSAGAGTFACFTLVAVGQGTPPKVCVGEGCAYIPHCEGKKESGERSNAQLDSKLNALNSSGSFALSPNPATGFVQVMESNTTANSMAQIRVVDMVGQTQIAVSPTGKVTNLDISRLPSGLYTVVVIDQSGTQHSKKLVVLSPH